MNMKTRNRTIDNLITEINTIRVSTKIDPNYYLQSHFSDEVLIGIYDWCLQGHRKQYTPPYGSWEFDLLLDRISYRKKKHKEKNG